MGLLRALCTHFASAPFRAPVADLGGGGSHAAHYQAVTAAQSQRLGGVGSVGYVEVVGHEDVKFHCKGRKNISINRICGGN